MTDGVLLLGDLILDEPDPDSFFEPSRELLRSADLVDRPGRGAAHGRGVPSSVDIPAPPADPAHLEALARAGHRRRDARREPHLRLRPERRRGHDRGAARARDRDRRGRDDDRRGPPPGGRRGGRARWSLSYNCVGPRESRATSRKAGAARARRAHPLRARLRGARAARRGSTRSSRPRASRCSASDVLALRETVDVVVVAFHKGIGHVPVVVPAYERELARTAIDCGADIVVGHHAHILRGIEVYRGKPVFHGLGNFVAVTHALTPRAARAPRARRLGEAAARAVRVRARSGDAVLSLPPESRNTIDRRLPDRRGRRRRRRASSRAGSTTAAGPCRASAATRSRPTSSGSRARPASTPSSRRTASACRSGGTQASGSVSGP